MDKFALVEQAKQKLLREIGAARVNPAKFFSLVIREEASQRRVRCLPHQEVLFKFVEHFERCVVRMPVGSAKTMSATAYSMFLLGRNQTTRGAIISATREQAQKPVGAVRDYIENSLELRAVFPKLRQSSRDGDPWTQSRITVERPPGIRDASLTAVGHGGKLPGSRLNWILVDDILTLENTSTEQQRKGITRWFFSDVLSRRDIVGTKIVVTNTPYHPQDLTYTLEAAGWPTMTVDIFGNLFFTNTCPTDLAEGVSLPREGAFDADDIRPSWVHFPKDDKGELVNVDDTRKRAYRLTHHDQPKYDANQAHLEYAERTAFFDAHDVVPLWPERFGLAEIESLKDDYRHAMHQFNQMYRCLCRDDEAGKVKASWIEACKEKARAARVHAFTSKWDPTEQGPTFTGVDLGVGRKVGNDRSCIFTFAVLPDADSTRRLLRIDSGHWTASTIVDNIEAHHEMFSSIIRVENNGAQDYLRQQAQQKNKNLPIRGVPTGANKMHKAFGVESIFSEVENALWLIPNDVSGRVDEETQRWIDDMLYYDPVKHTGDTLMACWIAREQARSSGMLRPAHRRNQPTGLHMVSVR